MIAKAETTIKVMEGDKEPKSCCGCLYVFRQLWRQLTKKKKNSKRKTDDLEVYAKKEDNEASTLNIEEKIETIKENEALVIIEDTKVVEVIETIDHDSVTEESKVKEQEATEETLETVNAVQEEGQQEGQGDLKKGEKPSQLKKKKPRPRAMARRAQKAQGLQSGVMYVPGEALHATSEDWTVVRDKRNRPRKAKPLPPVTEAAVCTQQQKPA